MIFLIYSLLVTMFGVVDGKEFGLEGFVVILPLWQLYPLFSFVVFYYLGCYTREGNVFILAKSKLPL